MPRAVVVTLDIYEADEVVGSVQIERVGNVSVTGNLQQCDLDLIGDVGRLLRSVKYRFKYTVGPPKAREAAPKPKKKGRTADDDDEG